MTTTDLSPAPKCIMIVDDEIDICAIFKKFLEIAGYNVFAFTDPLLAFEHLKINNEKYGLIISDVRMPVMNGIELVAKIRELNITIPIMLMSAFEMSSMEVSASLNIAKFLEKPIMPSKLKEAISSYLPIAAK